MFDLRNFREEVLKLTQKELATLIDERQDKISRLEKNPDSIGLDILIKIADKTGTTLDELVKYKKTLPDALDVQDTWKEASQINKWINDYVMTTIENNSIGSKQLIKVNEVKEFTEKSLRKPKVAIVGLSDTGKSTLINSLLGGEKMPAAWTPTTAISIYIKHTDDRPEYITDDVWFFKHHVDREFGWDSNRLTDEDYTNKFLISKGHIQDLQELAVRKETGETTVGSAVVFMNSPILKVCDLIDLPGYNTGDRELDTYLSEHVRDYADIMIYMSLANGFMRGNDIEYLKSDLNFLPLVENKVTYNKALSNLFVIASQAHVVNKGNRSDLKKVLNEGSKRLFSQIPKDVWEYRSKVTGIDYDLEALKSRFFTYSKDIVDLRKSFESELMELIEDYPKLLVNQYKLAMTKLCDINKVKISQNIQGNNDINNKREDYKKLVENIEGKVTEVLNKTRVLVENVEKESSKHKTKSINEFTNIFDNIVSVESVIGIIDQEKYTNVKRDIEKLGSYLNSRIQSEMRMVLKERSFVYAKDVNDFVYEYDQIVGNISSETTTNYNYSSKEAFIKGLGQCHSIGANAAWTSTLGDLSSYTILGDGVNLISSLFYSLPLTTGQTFTPVGGVANSLAFTGLIGLGIGLGMLAVTSMMSIFGSGWKKSIAKKIVAAYKNQNALVTYTNAIEIYWEETDHSFKHGVEYLENHLMTEIAELSAKVTTYDSGKLDKSNNLENVMTKFYDGIGEKLK